MKRIDYIIIGQGIAGSLLGWELMSRGFEILIIDDGYKTNSSIVAAGIMNPITGMRIVKSWQVDKFLELAKKYYRFLEEQLGVSVFKELEILRLFKNAVEVEQWEKRKVDPEYQEYIGKRFEKGAWGEMLKDDFGSFIINGGGSLDTKLFLEVMRKYFKDQGVLHEHELDYKAIELEDEDQGVRYGDVRGRKMIFCEGYKVIENPWFADLAWVPAKGEMLTVKLDSALPERIINQGKWLMPVGEGKYRAGATYNWENLDCSSTEAGRAEIVEDLRAILKEDKFDKMTVVEQLAGVRPCTRDMKPYVGLHKEHKCLGIFNGLGSKGTLMGPYYAQAMGEFLQSGKVLDSEVSVERS